MPYEKACRLIDEIAQKQMTKNICLHLMGEPTLHPQVVEIAQYANTHGLHVLFVTNGSTLSEKRTEQLLSLENAEMTISIQETDEISFEARSRKKQKYSDYVNHIIEFVKRAREMSTRLKIQIHYLTNISKVGNNFFAAFRELKYVNGIYNYWRGELGLPLKKIFNLFNSNKGFDLTSGITFWPKYRGDWSHQMLDENQKIIPSTTGECEAFGNSFAVLSDGTCTYCCQDFEGALNLGNAFDTSLEEVYYSDRALHVRENGLKGILVDSLCQICRGRLVDSQTGKTIKTRNLFSQLYLFAYFLKTYGWKNTWRRVRNRLKK